LQESWDGNINHFFLILIGAYIETILLCLDMYRKEKKNIYILIDHFAFYELYE